MNGEQINLLPAIDDWKALVAQGWAVSIMASGTLEAKNLILVGAKARRDVPDGTIEITARVRGDPDDVVSVLKDLRTLSRLTFFGAP